MPLPDMYALLFFVACCISLLLGVHTLTLQPRAPLNRMFFLVCLSLAIWSFGFSLANTAETAREALIWRRVSAAGWTVLYSLFLRFTVVLTGRVKPRRGGWDHALLFLPGVIFLYVFSLGGRLADAQYQMVPTEAGWINVAPNNLWDWLFMAHYLTYAVAILVLLIRWGRRETTRQQKRLARVFVTSLVFALAIGFLTDQVLNKLGWFPLPQTGPLTTLAGFAVFGLMRRRIGLRSAFAPETHSTAPGHILNMERQHRVYHVLTYLYLAGGLLLYAVERIMNRLPLREVLPLSLSFLIIGILAQIITHARMREARRQTIMLILLTLTIPLIAFTQRHTASMVLWAIPFVFLMLSMVFNQTRFMLWIGLSTILTQIWIWILSPSPSAVMDAGDHVGRIFLYLFAIAMAWFVNRIYVARLQENESQIRFQKMISGISADLVRAGTENLGEIIGHLLKTSAELFEVEHALYVPFGPPDTFVEGHAQEWHAEHRDSILPDMADTFRNRFPWGEQRLHKGLITSVPDTSLLPETAVAERAFLTRNGIQAIMVVPVKGKSGMAGYLLYGSEKTRSAWKQDFRALLRILANLLSDVLIKVETQQEITFMAYYDALTALPNRTLFANRLKQAISHASRTTRLFGVILLDLDAFKTVNDSLGHDSGDELLRLVSLRLSANLRGQDTVARFGGDEFLLLVEDIEKASDLHTIAQKVVDTFEAPFSLRDQEFHVTASAGVAVYPVDGEEGESLIRHADLAMYAAKDKGKNQYAFCTEEIKEDVRSRMQLTNSLYRAQDRGELLLHYQPLVDAGTRTLSGVEALIRWQHPTLGLIPPGQFIPLAEKHGLIRDIGRWVLREACQQASEWHRAGRFAGRLCVNISVDQLRDPNFATMVEETLQETGWPAEGLELEMTESIAVREETAVVGVLEAVKELGVTLAIDDFGTEYSSLNRLKTLPIDRIKLDMHISRTVTESERDAAIARAVLRLAADLSLQVTAEGIETDAQQAFFQKNGCQELQGFLFARPLAPEDMGAWLLP